ncbi:MAG: putative type I polyketide synthase [Streblomastix strix]|uniref:Putative type I polyketide synthase n=1 Tax=Streblomastix strix TaxID=222440 RepID=A0A5J4U2Y7_9EUKA|nr:MAG: putative type I polyketide synthase [Streblomastix strix]
MKKSTIEIFELKTTGGVGLLALAIRKHIGAEVFCTVGQDHKRRFLELMGIKNIFNSRTTQFCEDVLNVTNRRGVDIMHNTFAGKRFIEAILACLAPRGRFIEIGKADLYGGTNVNILPMKKNISYFAIAVDQLILSEKDSDVVVGGSEDSELGEIMNESSQLLCSGAIEPIPTRTFPLNEAQNAFSYLESAQYIGKVVLSPNAEVFAPISLPQYRTVIPLCSQGSYVRVDGTYLVTG